MKFQHVILIQQAESELDRPVGFFGDRPDDVNVISSVHVTNSNCTEIFISTFSISALPLINITKVTIVFSCKLKSVNINVFLDTNTKNH